MRFLRKNTAVIVTVGPFYDKTDGVTIETALTITNERITLTADTDDGSAPTNILDNVTGATSGTANDLNYITGNDAGLMQLELAAADVNRLGRMFLSITDAANHCPVFHEFMVINAALYDSLFATTGGAIPNVAANATGGLYASVVRGATAQAGAAGTITLDASASAVTDFYAGQLCHIVSGTGAGQSRIISAYNGTTKVATVGSNWATNPDSTSVFVIEALPGVIAANTPTNFSLLSVDSNGRVDVIKVAGTTQTAGDIIGDTNDIQTRIPAALTAGGNMKSDALAINGVTGAAANLAKTTAVIGRGTASGTPSTTSIPTSAFSPAGVDADQFKGRIITFDADTTTTALRGQSTDITASSAAATPTFTVTALTIAPVSGDTFSVT